MEEYKTVGRIKNVNAYWIKFKSDKWNPKNKSQDWLLLLGRYRPEGRPGRLIPSSQHSRPRRSVPVPAKLRRPLSVRVTPCSPSRAPPSSYQPDQTDNTHSSTCIESSSMWLCLATLSPPVSVPLLHTLASESHQRRERREEWLQLKWNIWNVF